MQKPDWIFTTRYSNERNYRHAYIDVKMSERVDAVTEARQYKNNTARVEDCMKHATQLIAATGATIYYTKHSSVEFTIRWQTHEDTKYQPGWYAAHIERCDPRAVPFVAKLYKAMGDDYDWTPANTIAALEKLKAQHVEYKQTGDRYDTDLVPLENFDIKTGFPLYPDPEPKEKPADAA